MIIPPWVYGAAGLLAVGVGFASGWTVRDWKRDAEVLKGVEDAAKKLDDARATVNTAATAYEQEKASAATNTTVRESTIREIYKDRPVSADCAVPAPAAAVLQDAVRDANARAAGQPGAAVPRAAGTAKPAD